MKGNVWLAGFIIVSILVLGAVGFYAIKEYNGYAGKFGQWDDRASRIARLEKEVPTPTAENVENFTGQLENYEAKVAELFESLNQFQRPLNLQLDHTEFPNILKQKVDDFRKLARDSEVDIQSLENPEPFFMAMDRYRETLPKQEITPLLGYQLDGIERILGHLVGAGMERIDALTRQDLPGENDEDDTVASGGGVVKKYQVTAKFEGPHDAFQDFLNRLANDREYFFILRVLTVQNSAPDGPDFAGDPAVIGYRRSDGSTVPEDEVRAKTQDKTGPELDEVILGEGWTPLRQDAIILFGEETVDVVAVIDLVRFMPPNEAAAAAEAEADAPKSPAGGRRRSGGSS